MTIPGSGVGLDLVEIARIRMLLERYGDKALARLLDPEERAYVGSKRDPAPHVAGFVAAKEACFKVLGAGPGQGIGWHDLGIRHSSSGAPTIVILGRAARRLESMQARGIAVSISHERSLAGAVAVLIE